MSHPFWPLFDLEVHTPRLVLRYVDDDLAIELAGVAAAGVHDPTMMPFSIPWTDAESPELERGALAFWWRCRAETRPESWTINFAVVVDGRAVGATTLVAADFPVLRTFETGSWLGRAFQGQGIGTEMRRASLHLGFVGFGAELATTGAFPDNAASLGVTRKIGYEPNGSAATVRRGGPAEIQRFRLTRERWEQTVRRDDVILHGVEPCLDLIGLG